MNEDRPIMSATEL